MLQRRLLWIPVLLVLTTTTSFIHCGAPKDIHIGGHCEAGGAACQASAGSSETNKYSEHASGLNEDGDGTDIYLELEDAEFQRDLDEIRELEAERVRGDRYRPSIDDSDLDKAVELALGDVPEEDEEDSLASDNNNAESGSLQSPTRRGHDPEYFEDEEDESEDEMNDLFANPMPVLQNISRFSFPSFADGLVRAQDRQRSCSTGSTDLSQEVDADTDDIVVICSSLEADNAGIVTAFEAESGDIRWRLVLPGVITGEPAFSSTRELVFVATQSWALFAVSVRNGLVVWTFCESGAAFVSSPRVGVRSTVYIGNVNGVVFALDAKTGTVTWTRALGSGAITTQIVPAMSRDDMPIVVASVVEDGTDGDADQTSTPGSNVVALDAITGGPVWSTRLNGTIMHAPVVYGENVIYFGVVTATNHSVLLSVSAVNGKIRSSDTICANTTHSPGLVLATDSDFLLAVCSDGTLFSMTADELKVHFRISLKRRMNQSVDVIAAPSRHHDVIVFVAPTNGVVLMCGVSTGRLMPVYILDEPVVAAPTKGPYGNVYMVGYNGTVVCKETSDAEPLWTAQVPGNIYVSPVYI